MFAASQPLHKVGISQHLSPDAAVIGTLDLQQERAAKQIGSGHRILSGVAGRKTLILTSRAKWMLEEDPTKDPDHLLQRDPCCLHQLCHSRNDNQRPTLCQPGVEARHFHGWAKAVCGSLPVMATA